MKPTDIAAISVCTTVCACLLVAVIGMTFAGPERVKDTGREAVTTILSMLVGIVSGYVLRDRLEPK